MSRAVILYLMKVLQICPYYCHWGIAIHTFTEDQQYYLQEIVSPIRILHLLVILQHGVGQAENTTDFCIPSD